MKKTSYFFATFFIATSSILNGAESTLSLKSQISLLASGGTKEAVLALASLSQNDDDFKGATIINPLKKMFGTMPAFRTELAEFKKRQGSAGNCLTPQQVQAEISKAGLPTVAINDKKDAARELVSYFDNDKTGGQLLKALGADNGEIASVKQALTKATAKA